MLPPIDNSPCTSWYWGWADCEDACGEQRGFHYFQVRLRYLLCSNKDIMCRVEKSDYFTRKGADVYTDASISLAQSALGGSIRVQGIYEDLNIQIPPGTNSHTRYWTLSNYRRSWMYVGWEWSHFKEHNFLLLMGWLCLPECQRDAWTETKSVARKNTGDLRLCCDFE